MKPRVSVIVALFNGEKYVRRAVESLLAERLRELEIIVVDDGSTDGSVGRIGDLPVRLVRQLSNCGAANAQNVGVAEARGEYVTFLDSDDVLAPNAIRWRLNWLAAHCCDRTVGGRPAGIIDERGKPCPKYPHVMAANYSPPHQLSLAFFRAGGTYPVASWNYMFRRSLLEEVGPFNSKLKIAYDLDFLLRVLRHTQIPIVLKPTVYRRLHHANLSLRSDGDDYQLRSDTIEECKRIFEPLGIRPSHWNIWEKGYQP